MAEPPPAPACPAGGGAPTAAGGGAPGAGPPARGGGPNGGGVSGAGLGSGIGVSGHSATATGTGMLADNTGGGNALRVSGPSLFSRSGTVVIPFGQTKATVAPPGGLTASALVLALMQNVTGGVM